MPNDIKITERYVVESIIDSTTLIERILDHINKTDNDCLTQLIINSHKSKYIKDATLAALSKYKKYSGTKEAIMRRDNFMSKIANYIKTLPKSKKQNYYLLTKYDQQAESTGSLIFRSYLDAIDEIYKDKYYEFHKYYTIDISECDTPNVRIYRVFFNVDNHNEISQYNAYQYDNDEVIDRMYNIDDLNFHLNDIFKNNDIFMITKDSINHFAIIREKNKIKHIFTMSGDNCPGKRYSDISNESISIYNSVSSSCFDEYPIYSIEFIYDYNFSIPDIYLKCLKYINNDHLKMKLIDGLEILNKLEEKKL